MNNRLIIFGGILLLLCTITMRAQEKETMEHLRPITTSTMLHMGGAQLEDTYLSPNMYQGYNIGISNERMQILRWGKERITTQQNVGINFMSGRNTAQNGRLYGGFINYSYGFFYTWRPFSGFKLLAGGDVGASVGFIYNPKNSNNPASAKANLHVGLSGMGIYTFRIKNYPITCRYQLTLPCASIFFSPQFGQSYYEIFSLGNHNGISHFGSLHNHFEIENFFTIDLPLGRNSVRLGYKHQYWNENANNIETRINTNSFILGVTGEFLPINQRKRDSKAPIINAYY